MDKRLVYYSPYVNFGAKLGILPFEIVRIPKLEFRIKKNTWKTYFLNVIAIILATCNISAVALRIFLEDSRPIVTIKTCGFLAAIGTCVMLHLFCLLHVESLINLSNKVINAHPKGIS
jgi:hypothetical protein